MTPVLAGMRKGAEIADALAERKSEPKHLRIDAIGRPIARKKRGDVVGNVMRHRFARLADGAAEMRREHDIGEFSQRRADLRFVLEYVEAGAGDLSALQRVDERGLVDNRPARGVDEVGGLLHQLELAGADLMPRFLGERRVHRHEVGLPQQIVERHVG